jgi:thiamine biosynthesis lipoprotein
VNPLAQLERPEHCERFRCFGSDCGVWVSPAADGPDGRLASGLAKLSLLDLHRRFTRFDPSSELSTLNADPRERIPVSTIMARFIQAATTAARMTDGLVDPTLLDDLRRAGYDRDLERPLALGSMLELAPERSPGAPASTRAWEWIRLLDGAQVLERPVGVKLDSGGIAKGLFADVIAESLKDTSSYGIDCAGDLRIGGSAGVSRVVDVQSPFDHGVLHSYELTDGGVATSGIGARSWLDVRGAPAHHLLDPATRKPAFTGIVQVSALACSALEAEIRAKAALLSGPARATAWLEHGGTIVYEDGSFDVL